MTDPTRAIRLYGTEAPTPEVRAVRAGGLSAELEAGKLRYVRRGGHEALRGLAFVVRGPGWETFAPTLTNLSVEESGGGFRIGYDARIEAACGTLTFRAEIEAVDESGLRFSIEGAAETAFETGRTGFVVLHPVEGVAGAPCRIDHTDGTHEDTVFPDLVMPLQPFFDIRAMRHQVAPGLWLTCHLDGADPWETEDQRNWTDASYKTYFRPLALPFPYTLAAGERFSQTAELRFEGAPPASGPTAGGDAIAVRVDGPTGATMPLVGLGVQASHANDGLDDLDLIRPLGAHYLVCQFNPSAGHGAAELAGYRDLAAALGLDVTLEIVVPCERPVADEIAEAAAAVGAAGLTPASVIVEQKRLLYFTLETIEALGIPSFEETYAAARAAFPGVRLGGGVLTNFTELNRNHPDPALFDYLTHNTCAVVHEPDDRSVMETLQSLPSIVATAKSFAGGKPYRLGPSAIGMRFNPYGPSTHDNQDNGRHSFNQQDPRQRSLLGAAFTLGYMARVAPLGIEAIALGMPAGELGAVYRKMGHEQPWFDTLAGPAVFPLYHIVAGMAQASGAALRTAESDDPTRVLALAHEVAGGGTRLWLANLTPSPQRVEVAGVPSEAMIGGLDEDKFVAATTDPLAFQAAEGQTGDPRQISLKPFGIARITTDG